MTKKRILAWVLTLLMLMNLMPTNVLAEAVGAAAAQTESAPAEAPAADLKTVTSNTVEGAEYAELAFVRGNEDGTTVAIAETIAVEVGLTVGDLLPRVPELKGYTFEGWVDENDQQVTTDTVITADMTIKAVYADNMPAQNFIGSANGVSVIINAPQGAFPAGAKMVVSAVSDSAVLGAVEGVVEGDVSVKAVDISFYDVDGADLEPQKDVKVFLYSDVNPETESKVVHIDDAGEASVVADIESNRAEFSTDAFSVYVVVDQGEDARLQVNFVLANGETKSMLITKPQIEHIEQYIYDPGVGTLESNELFLGWTKDPNYTADSDALTIAEIREEIVDLLNAGVTDYVAANGSKVTYYAKIMQNYTITYLDEKSITVKTDQVLFARTDTKPQSYTVNLSYEPYAPTGEEAEQGMSAEFKGWQQIVPTTSELTLYENGTDIEVSSDVTLFAYVKKGYWLIFDENLSGASYTQPQFIEGGDSPTAPAENPTRVGYKFEGWYTEDASSARDGQVAGSQFNFNQNITENTTVYGKWTEVPTADYTVIIWTQNLDGETYDFQEAVTLTGNVRSTINTVSASGTGNNRYASVNGTAKRYTGFHLNTFDTGVTVSSAGNSVVNVYYDRNSHTFTFRRNNSTVHTFTALYGQDISNEWSFTGTDGRTYPQTNPPTSWQPSGSSTYTARITRMEVMPDEDITFSHMTTNNTTRYFHYYVEALPGATNTRTYNGMQYSLYTDLTHDFNIIFYNDDFWNLDGFTRQAIATANGTNVTSTIQNARNGSEWQSSWNNNLYFYYTRNSYDIIYRDGVYTNGDGAVLSNVDKLPDSAFEKATGIKYQADISDRGSYSPTRSGYVFLGWYADSSCTREYNFGTMPSNNVTVYAKWVAREYNIVLHPNDSTDDPIKYTNAGQPASFYADYGDKIGNVGGERVNWDLVGWYYDAACTHSFSFSAIVMNDQNIATYGNPSYREDGWPSVVGQLNLYAKWRSKLDGANGINVVYDAGDGSNAPKDNHSYTDLAEAIAGPASTAADEDNMVFSHWVIQEWDGSEFVDTEEIVYPSETFSVRKALAKEEDVTDPNNPDITKKYTMQLRAEYIEKDKELLTHIYWYSNYGSANDGKGELYHSDERLKINEAVDILDAQTRTGYIFKGWTKTKGGTNADFLVWTGSGYTHNGRAATQVAADERLPYDDLFAVWEADTVDYTVEFYYQNDNGVGYTKDDTLTATRQAKTDTTVNVTDADKGQTKNNKYKLVSGEPSVLSATVAGDGTTVLKLYFDLNMVGYTIHHYLNNSTTKVADDQTGDEVIGQTVTATAYSPNAAKLYDDYKTVVFTSFAPTSGSVTIQVDESKNEIIVYYVIPETIDPGTGDTTFGTKNLQSTTADDKPHTFSFTLAAETEGAPMPAKTTAEVEYEAGAIGEKAIPFGEITYTKLGTYTYTITEDTTNYPADKGWTTTGNVATVTVNVTAGDAGKLVVAVTSAPAIVNKYEADEIEVNPAEGETIFGKKKLSATTEDGKDHEFSFTLSAEAGVPMPASATASVTYEAGKTGEQVIPFGKITYDKTGEYEYTITETVGEYTEANGWTITNNEAKVVVTITDNGDGTLSAKIDGTETIENSYEHDDVVVDPTKKDAEFGIKNLTATTEDGKGHTFSFTIEAVTEGAPMPESATAEVTYEAAETGEQTIPFGTITFSEVGTYEYTITEDVTEYTDNGWTTGDPITVTVEVTDNGKGALEAAVTGDTIENEYTMEEITVDPTDSEAKTEFGKKNVTTTTEDGKGHDFSFTLAAGTGTATDGKTSLTVPMPETATATTSYKAAETGEQTIPFGEITYTKPGTYTYTITEDVKDYEGKGWTTTGNAATVTVTITDNGDGTMSAESTTVTITNSYKANPVEVDTTETDAEFAKKTVEGEGFKTKEFAFEIAADEGAPAVKNTTAKQSFSEAGTKTLDFGTITFDKVGTYTYKVKETTKAVVGDGWTLDNAEKTVTVTITDNGVGQLVAKVEGVEIKNSYDSKPELNLTKTADLETYKKAGEIITYTITVENTGNVTVKDITVTDELSGVEIQSGDGYSVNDDGTVAIASILPGESVVITATYTVKQEDLDIGSITNAAKVTGEDPGDKPVDDKTETETPADQEGHLTVVKETTSKTPEGGYKLGATVSYKITATNDGNLTLTNITVTDERTGLSEKVESLAPGASVEYTTSTTVTEEDILSGHIINDATAKGTSPDPDEKEVPVKPGHTDDDPEDPNGHLTVVKETTSKTPEGGYKLGATVSYKITATNDGNLTLTNITVTDERTGLSEKVDSLAPGASVEYTTSTTVTEEDILSGHIINDATAKGTSPDPNEKDVPVTPGHTDDDPEDPNGHLTVIKVATSKPAHGGKYVKDEKVTYEITVVNDGNLTITDITVMDDLTGNQWTVDSLKPGASQVFTTEYTVTEADVKAGKVVNVATAEGTSPDPENPEPGVTPGTEEVPTGEEAEPFIGAAASSNVGDCFE